ncbi:glucuronosyltransferase [Nesidiocoris tenuis]|uniref:Glucuronosyltransferase n=1 Tax=Nesidiocoris tenuis TaxID=355587 RepID=A0ABN7ASL3_9HEMI|nr:glucuronosyltransferase [Nesidiocoris tenuis]
MDGLDSAPLGLIDNIRQVFDGLEDYESMLTSRPIREFLVKNSSYDLVIVELFNTDMFLPIVHRFGAPYIAISPCFAGRPMDLTTRAWNVLYHLAFTGYYDFVVGPVAQRTVDRIFPDAPPLSKLASNVSLILVNTHGSLHQPPNSSPRIVEIGGSHLGHQDPIERHEIHAWLDKYTSRGTILFSLGSMFNAGSIPEAKRNIFRNALKRLPQLVIWKMALPPGENRTDGNIVYSEWVPQEIVLGHESVNLFIYHGGLLGILEAVSSGVPILGLPMFGDMASNMAAVEASGAGLALPYRNLTEDLFYDTIVSMINDTRYKNNAKKLASLFNDRPVKPLDLAVYWCEYVINHKGAPHLRKPTLAWYQVWVYRESSKNQRIMTTTK